MGGHRLKHPCYPGPRHVDDSCSITSEKFTLQHNLQHNLHIIFNIQNLLRRSHPSPSFTSSPSQPSEAILTIIETPSWPIHRAKTHRIPYALSLLSSELQVPPQQKIPNPSLSISAPSKIPILQFNTPAAVPVNPINPPSIKDSLNESTSPLMTMHHHQHLVARSLSFKIMMEETFFGLLSGRAVSSSCILESFCSVLVSQGSCPGGCR